jgi:NADH-quinone oxidoreductase subunit C
MAQEPGQGTTVAEPDGHKLADLFGQALPALRITAEQTPIDVAITVRREDLLQVMQTAKEDGRLAFDFLRSLSGVDYLDELEVVYHLYSYQLGHSVAVKVRCPPDDPHLPSVSHLWQAANWHEREAAEMFGFVFGGHPDLRPLLTEEGLGYYPLRKMHPLAEIEEWQEDYVAVAEAAEPPGERARRKVMAQKRAAIIRKAREEARARGLSAEEEKEAIQAVVTAFEEEEAKGMEMPPKPVDDHAAKIALAEMKAAIVKKAREEARARGASRQEERQAVKEALKGLVAEEEEGD